MWSRTCGVPGEGGASCGKELGGSTCGWTGVRGRT